jgi:polar amino acid transport system substrate-binding protein
MRAGRIDAIALSRESVGGLVEAMPGSRVLDEAFLNSTTAIAVPKNRPAALAFITAFIEEAKASGAVRRALDAMGLTSSQVAPVGMKA